MSELKLSGQIVTKEINGRKFQVHKMTTRQSLRVSVGLMSMWNSSGEGVDPDQVVGYAETFAKYTIVTNNQGAEVPLAIYRDGEWHFDSFDNLFQDDYNFLLKWLEFCAEVNFERFLDTTGVRGIFREMIRATDPSSSDSQSEEQSGSSGE